MKQSVTFDVHEAVVEKVAAFWNVNRGFED